MIYITGDTHRDFTRVWNLCRHRETTRDDILIILGDVGINYYGGRLDKLVKEKLSRLPITLLCIHGNHEMRPQHVPTYVQTAWHGGTVLTEQHYPNLLFAPDGEIYTLGGKRCIVIGGAYSVDKQYRLEHGQAWFPDEQPSSEMRRHVEQVLATHPVDYVFSHTCPRKYEPTDTFADWVDQSRVDKSTENWLDRLEGCIDYERWYCGHFHISRRTDRMHFLFEEVEELETQETVPLKGGQ